MKLTIEKAREMLEEARKKAKDGRWIGHCICVGDSAGRIAKALKDKGIDVDVEKAIILGYIHDIGKNNGKFHVHVMEGYKYCLFIHI